MDLSALEPGETAGIVSLGTDYAGLALFRSQNNEYELVAIRGTMNYSKEAVERSSKPNYNGKTAVADEQTESISIDKSIPEQNLHEIVFQTEVKIKEYKDFLDRVDYLGQEQWARHIPQEEITLTVFIGNTDSPIASVRIPATAGRWVGVKCGVFCHSKNGLNSEFKPFFCYVCIRVCSTFSTVFLPKNRMKCFKIHRFRRVHHQNSIKNHHIYCCIILLASLYRQEYQITQ